jgi:hypothetical protein
LSNVVGEERHGRATGPPGRSEVKSVEGASTGDLGDVGGRVARTRESDVCPSRDAIQLDDREDGDVLEERCAGGRGVTVFEKAGEVAPNLDDRMSRSE